MLLIVFCLGMDDLQILLSWGIPLLCHGASVSRVLTVLGFLKRRLILLETAILVLFYALDCFGYFIIRMGTFWIL